MTPLQFEASYSPVWDELEAALNQIQGSPRTPKTKLDKKATQQSGQTQASAKKSAPKPDAARLATLYRNTCEHLALARARAHPARQTARLEALTERAHQLIYRRTDYGAARFARLFLIDFPQAVRTHWRYVLVAGLVFTLPLVLLGIATYLDPSFILAMHDAGTVESYEQMYGPSTHAIGRERSAGNDWVMFGYYIMNNISISFQCFASGIFLGLGSLFFLAYNGISAGGVAGFLTARGHGETFYSFVITHGAFELTAIVLSGAAGLRIGHALLAPGRRTRQAALEFAAADSAVLMYGVTAMLLIAAGLEAFWSSARWVPPVVKFSVGGACWALVWAYLSLQGRRRAVSAVFVEAKSVVVNSVAAKAGSDHAG
jgi:uncharacterized membrane protein SpoIIM required for sporulation